LVGVSFLFTAGGAVLGRQLGTGALLATTLVTFVLLFLLYAVREQAPLNLIVLYAFATCEGLLLGPLVDGYVADGMGDVVVLAAVATAVVCLAAGLYGATTGRDLSGLGGVLTVALLGIIVASVIGWFVGSPALDTAVSAAAVVVFTGFLAVDLQRAARRRDAPEGDAVVLAVAVYLDALNLFTALLHLFGRSRDDR
jgi:FtsH-binding integral membrane protein